MQLYDTDKAYITEGSITQDRQQGVNVTLTGEVKSGPHVALWRHDSSGISADNTKNLFDFSQNLKNTSLR